MIATTLIGPAVEWYDFFVFGIAAALFLNKLFFPSVDPSVGTVLSFSTFATGWLARPIGGLIAGHLGDRIGRKTTLLWSFTLMGAATAAVGVLPTYASAGIAAPILLVAVRIIQGLSAGAEFGGAIITSIEHAEPRKRGLYGAIPQMGVIIGLILGNASYFALTSLNQGALLRWGWRIPFLVSAVLVVVGVYIRYRVSETPEFLASQTADEQRRLPIVDVLHHYWRQALSVFFAQAGPNSFFYLLTTFMIAYGVTTLGFSERQMLGALVIAAAVEVVTLPLYGTLCDRVGRRRVFVSGHIALMAAIFPFFLAVRTGSWPLLVVAFVILLGVAHSATYSSQASLFAEMFPTEIRYSGLSIAYQLSGAAFGGPLPLIATALVAATGGTPWLLAGYTVAIAVISITAIMLGAPTWRDLPRTRGARPLTAPAASEVYQR